MQNYAPADDLPPITRTFAQSLLLPLRFLQYG